jgi:hypothetical protein
MMPHIVIDPPTTTRAFFRLKRGIFITAQAHPQRSTDLVRRRVRDEIEQAWTNRRGGRSGLHNPNPKQRVRWRMASRGKS